MIVNEDTGEIDEFPLDEEKPIDEVDPVNSVTLKTKYTNLNIARTLKKRIINSVIKHNKRAHKLMLEWQQQQKEKENNKEGEDGNKLKNAENHIPDNVNNIDTNKSLNIIKQSETNNEKVEINNKMIEEDCPKLINPEIKEPITDNNDFHLLEEKNHFEEKQKKKNKLKQSDLKRNQIEDFKDNDVDDEFDEFVENVKMKLNSNTKVENEDELINSINTNLLPKKRKSVQTLEKASVKRNKSNEVPTLNNLKIKSKKKVTFNLSENSVTSKY